MHHTTRTAAVTAESDVVLWRIPGPVFLDAVSRSGSAALLGGIAGRLARITA